MKFIDEAIITVQSGNGGKGCVSFRREKFIPRGGPNGGDGGQGGDLIFKSSSQKRTLYAFRYRKHFKAKNGAGGQGREKTGKAGDSLVIEVPAGTVITDPETGRILHDFIHTEETYVAAEGGRGGRGNKRFTTSTNRAPRFAQPGEPGQTLKLKLELKLIADVGIIGLPNAGKSTLVSVISSARPKIGDYPFTTLTPNLGVVENAFGEPFVVADIPGLIQGAHKGIGLGIKFLKHIERTHVLVHLVDAAAIDVKDPLAELRTIREELSLYSKTLAEKPRITVLNKMDLPEAGPKSECFKIAFKEEEVLQLSAATGKGVKQLIRKLSELLSEPDDT